MKRENAFFEEMKRTGHAWDDERRARLEQRREIEKIIEIIHRNVDRKI